MSRLDSSDDPPVTISVSRRIKPGCETAFEEVLLGTIAAAMSFEGHLGVNVFRLSDSINPEYRVIFKFDRMSNLRRWEESSLRRKWLERMENLTLSPPETQTLTGLEAWFTLPNQRVMLAPPRYKITLLTWLGIFPLITAILALFGPVVLNRLPLVLRTLVLTGVLVPLMTYVVMPRLTRWFGWWLYPSTSGTQKRVR
jgi:hypothetical protein